MDDPVSPSEAHTDVERTMPIRPLPRRRGQAHLEPQLREPGGAGTATPFGAFEDPAEEPAPDRSAADRRSGAGTRAARFRAATRPPCPDPPRRG